MDCRCHKSEFHFTNVVSHLTQFQWLKEAQELMSSTASNYDLKKLITGQVIAAIALVMTSVTAGPFIVKHLKASIPFIGICLLYGIMMFASSYVEEEQNFWYWTTTGWLFLLSIKKYEVTSPLKSKLITF